MIPIKNENQEMLKHLYQTAIDPRITSQIVLNGAPETIEAWMTKAVEMDANQRRANSLFSKGIQQGNKNRYKQGKPAWKPRLYWTNDHHDRGEPMDVDAINHQPPRNKPGRLSQREEQRRSEQTLCYNCGKPGHYSKDCRSPRNTGTSSSVRKPPQGEQRNEQRQFPKKKFTPQKMREHIRALIAENFEEGSEEMKTFIDEVEEQGF
jgi:hypothetical protein